MAKKKGLAPCEFKKIILFYEPKQTPILDRDGNVIGYSNVIALPSTLKDSDTIRLKTSTAERGLSGDKRDSVGFRRTLDVINQSRNLFGVAATPLGNDDLSALAAGMRQIENSLKRD